MPQIAESREDAEQKLTEYCLKTGFDKEWITKKQWDTTIDIALDPNFGLKDAEDTIDADRVANMAEKAKQARREALAADSMDLLDCVAKDERLTNSHAVSILQQCADAYIDGQRVNLGYGTALTRAKYARLKDHWDYASDYDGGSFTEFASHEPQDKAALGKGNVGDTLATRGVQGNLLVKINGMRFNMHIDITD